MNEKHTIEEDGAELAECVVAINKRLKNIEEWRRECAESTDWEDDAQAALDEIDHGPY